MAGPQDMPGQDGLPPGLAVYMSGHFDRARLAFQRTLASLAERGWLEITPGHAATSTARLVPAPGAELLPRSEALVLERVRDCSRSMPAVPLAVVTDFGSEDRQRWMRRFTDALAAEAMAAGLTYRRVRRALRYPLALLAAIVGGGLGALLDGRSHSGGAIGYGLITFVFALVVTTVLTSARPTPYGRRIASWARTQQVPQLSSITPRPAASPAALLEKDGRPLPAKQAVGSTALFWVPSYASRLQYPRRIVYRGQIVKKWTQSDDLDDDATLYCCSVDGGGEEAATYRVQRDAYKALGVGDVVEVRYSPRYEILRAIRRVG